MKKEREKNELGKERPSLNVTQGAAHKGEMEKKITHKKKYNTIPFDNPVFKWLTLLGLG